MPDNSPGHDRRAFFRNALAKALDPLANLIAHEPSPPTVTSLSSWLRPPGAIPEERFSDVCRRCGACVEACPATAIFPLAGFDDAIDGTPVVDPDRAACVVCDGLQCTHVCPSGALLPLLDPAQIDMGVAEVYESNCIRKYGEDCDLCLVQCPLGAAAIDLDPNDMPRVNEQGCVGCGVCQFACPPEPKAIVVKPRAAGA